MSVNSYGDELIAVRVVDVVSGEDITDSGSVTDVSLMVFDANEKFVTRIDIPREQLGYATEIPGAAITRSGPGGVLYISAWGNIAGAINEIGTGAEGVSGQFIHLKASDDHINNWESPGDLFFGFEKITLGQGNARANGKSVHVVPIMQKTARIAVTARGLPQGSADEDFFFSLCEQNDGLTFDGTPLQTIEVCKIRKHGVFLANGDYVLPDPINLIPSIDPHDAGGCKGGTCVYQVGGGLPKTRVEGDSKGDVNEEGDVNFSGKATTDSDGNHIAFNAGQTTNVLFEFSETGDVTVTVAITAWDEVYQWGQW